MGKSVEWNGQVFKLMVIRKAFVTVNKVNSFFNVKHFDIFHYIY